jgi:hypothetical protein
MATPRASNTATLLRDGRVLLAGGYPGEGRPPSATAELYDPATGAFTSARPMLAGRADHTATLLPDGQVLLAGGTDDQGNVLRTTELFNPATLTFRSGPRMTSPRTAHVAVIDRGAVVLIGGVGTAGRALRTTEVLRGQEWSRGPRMRTARVKEGAIALADGRISVVGGSRSTEGRTLLDSTELLDVARRTSTAGPRMSEGMYKLDGSLVRLADGRVVIPGGEQIDVLDADGRHITVLPGPREPRRSFLTASLIGRRTVLVVGGYDSAIVPTADARVVRIPAPQR